MIPDWWPEICNNTIQKSDEESAYLYSTDIGFKIRRKQNSSNNIIRIKIMNTYTWKHSTCILTFEMHKMLTNWTLTIDQKVSKNDENEAKSNTCILTNGINY